MKVVLCCLLVCVMSLQAGTLLTSDRLTVDEDNPSPLTIHDETEEVPSDDPVIVETEVTGPSNPTVDDELLEVANEISPDDEGGNFKQVAS